MSAKKNQGNAFFSTTNYTNMILLHINFKFKVQLAHQKILNLTLTPQDNY